MGWTTPFGRPGIGLEGVEASLEIRLRDARLGGTVGFHVASQNGVPHLMQEADASNPGPPRSPLDGKIVAVAELSERLDGMRSLAEASTAVAEFAVDHLGADLAEISHSGPDGRPVRLAASSDRLVQLDALELGLKEGPGMAPLDDGAVITIGDLRAGRRGPDWSSAAAERDMLSACLLGLPPLPGRSVALHLFSRRADAFAPGDATGLAAVARLAGLALRRVDRLANLEEAIATRDLIGQAQGMIMERYGLTGEQAMEFLRRSSQHSQEKVWQIANRLVAEHPARDRDPMLPSYSTQTTTSTTS